jgi:uncharacterized protein
MLIGFSVGNFMSFKDAVMLNLTAANIKARDQRLDEDNVAEVSGLRLLKSAAIYGPNASGKSNLAAAIAFMRRFLLNSSKDTQADEPIGIEPFLLSEQTESAPSLFEIVFLLDGKRYRYGFEVTRERVVAEWLFFVPTIKEARLFERSADSIEVGERFKEGRGLEARTRKNSLFLSVVAQFNGQIAQRILSWFAAFQVITGLQDAACSMYTLNCFEKGQYVPEIIELVRRLDLSIDHIAVERTKVSEDNLPTGVPEPVRRWLLDEMDTNHTITTRHKKYDREGRRIDTVEFDLDSHESEGTKKLFSFAGPLVHTLRTGKPLFVDELDARWHTDITRTLVGLFNSRETNPNNAQLIFTTHDTNLLTNKLFRRDQIWFVEKDRYGSSRLHSLVEYKVRNDASFESDYLRGRYGAVPFIGDLSHVAGEPGASQEGRTPRSEDAGLLRPEGRNPAPD